MTAIGYGWAIVEDNQIDMKTVHDSRRGAIVNRLYNMGYAITNDMTDKYIFALWENVKGKQEAWAVTVASSGVIK